MERQEGSGLGFCPDFQPDLTVGRAQERLLVASQDVAHDLTTLRELGVTHILNVAWGVPNAFTSVSQSLSLFLSLCSRTNPYGWEACHLCLLG